MVYHNSGEVTSSSQCDPVLSAVTLLLKVMTITNERRVVVLGPAPNWELQRVLGELDWRVAGEDNHHDHQVDDHDHVGMLELQILVNTLHHWNISLIFL